MSKVKQIIVIRKDLGMRRGKECAQSAHASIAFLLQRLTLHEDGNENSTYALALTDEEIEWRYEGQTKICVRVESEQELDDIYAKAKTAGLEVHLITDSGHTEFNMVPTKTCLAIGPDDSEKIDRITGHLQLY